MRVAANIYQDELAWTADEYSHCYNRHHKVVRGNYGLYFTLWDKVMGTYKA